MSFRVRCGGRRISFQNIIFYNHAMKKFSTISYILSAAILIFAGAIIVKGQSATFLAPAGAPSAATNVREPINVSTNTQIKDGAFGVEGIIQAFSDVIVD